MGDAGQRKQGFRELGPVWITAISGLIVALTGAGFFAGRATAPTAAPQPSTPPGASTVVQQAAPASSVAPSSRVSDPPVFWSGELDWGSYDLDFNPPRTVGGRSIQDLMSTFYVDGTGPVVTEWQTDSIPSENDCDSAAVSRGTNQTTGLSAGEYICGRTAEGRVFRVNVISAGDSGIRSQTVVWKTVAGG